jgi:hypothetical protein
MSHSGIGKRRRSNDRSKNKKKNGGDDLHDFIHDIEFSAKKILKQHMQKRLTEATLERREKRRQATGLLSGSPPGKGTDSQQQQMGFTASGEIGSMTQSGMHIPSPGIPGMSPFGGPATDSPTAFSSTLGSTISSFNSTGGGGIPMSMSMGSSMGGSTLPTIGSGMSASVLSGGASTMGNSTSLPQLQPSSSSPNRGTTNTQRRKRLSAQDKAKLKASPFARTRRSIDEEEAIERRSKVKTDKTVGMTGGKMLREAAKLAGATIKGDAHALSMLRADHAVDRKMSTQAWTDPDSKTGVEKGMSTLGLVLDRAHELQGPTGWSSDDLRRKYRDETERLSAYEAGVEAKKEAERLEREQNIIRSFVEIPMHPLHMYFVSMCDGENEMSKRRARNRNQLKTFSLDLITLWHANRPEEEGSSSKMGPEGQISRIKGLMNRRPAHAIKAFNAQVQSVSVERAMQGSMSSSQLHLMGKFGNGGGDGHGSGEGGIESLVTQSERDAKDAEATRQRRMMWQRPWFRTTVLLPILEDGPPGEVEKLLDLTWDNYESRHQNETLKRVKKREQMMLDSTLKIEDSVLDHGDGNNEGEKVKEKETVENPEEQDTTNRIQYASAGVSVFRRGRGELRRLVIHVHDTEETTASALQVSEKEAD